MSTTPWCEVCGGRHVVTKSVWFSLVVVFVEEEMEGGMEAEVEEEVEEVEDEK